MEEKKCAFDDKDRRVEMAEGLVGMEKEIPMMEEMENPIKKLTTKSLDGTDYELDSAFDYCDIYCGVENNHKPEQIIIPYQTFGIGSRLQMKENNKEKDYGPLVIADTMGSAVVTQAYTENGNFIIKASENTHKEEKIRYANDIIKELDFSQGLGNERFVEMLSNVFTEKQLKELLEADDIEILLFDGLMYVKLGDKAYRL